NAAPPATLAARPPTPNAQCPTPAPAPTQLSRPRLLVGVLGRALRLDVGVRLLPLALRPFVERQRLRGGELGVRLHVGVEGGAGGEGPGPAVAAGVAVFLLQEHGAGEAALQVAL